MFFSLRSSFGGIHSDTVSRFVKLEARAAAVIVGRLSGAWHPILRAGLGDLAATLVVFAFSLAYNNSSFYDPYWSVAPPFLALFWLLAAGSGGLPVRQALARALPLAWAARVPPHLLRCRP